MSMPGRPRGGPAWLAIALALALGACAAPQAPEQPRVAATPQVLIAWYSLDGAREQALLDLVDRWNLTNPWGITVAPERRATAALHQGVLDGIPGAALPALMLVSPMQAAVYDQRGALAPLNAYLSDAPPGAGWSAADRADLYPFVASAGRSADGDVIGVPFGGVARVMFINRDWLKALGADQAPADWDQFAAACAAAADRTQGTLCFGANAGSAVFTEWLLAHGGRPVAGSANVMQIATPAGYQAIGRLAGLARANQAYRATTDQQSQDDFAAGRVLMAFDWSDRLADYRNAVEQRDNFDWGIGLLPASGSAPATPMRAPLWVVARSTPDRQLAAWLFVRWLLDPGQTAEWAMRTGELPARASAMNDEAARAGADPLFPAVLQAIAPAAQPEPLIGGWGCIQSVLSAALRDILDGKPVTETLQIAQFTAQSEVDFDCSLQSQQDAR